MLVCSILGLAGSVAHALPESQGKKAEWKITISHWKLCHAASHSICPSKKAETKMISQMNSKPYSGISNKIWTCSLFISVLLHISHWQCFHSSSTRWSRTATSLWLPLVAVVMISWWSRASRGSPESGRRAWRSWSLQWLNQRYATHVHRHKSLVWLICGCWKPEPRFCFASMGEVVSHHFVRRSEAVFPNQGETSAAGGMWVALKKIKLQFN